MDLSTSRRFGHVERMNNRRLKKRTNRARWMENVKKDEEELEWGASGAEGMREVGKRQGSLEIDCVREGEGCGKRGDCANKLMYEGSLLP